MMVALLLLLFKPFFFPNPRNERARRGAKGEARDAAAAAAATLRMLLPFSLPCLFLFKSGSAAGFSSRSFFLSLYSLSLSQSLSSQETETVFTLKKMKSKW